MVGYPQILPPHVLTSSDTLLDLHAKLATVVRYYDRMLEERLSSTYSQHSISGYGVAQRPHRSSSNIYPTIPLDSHHGQGGAESFYTGNAMPSSEPYARIEPGYNHIPQPQSPYHTYERKPIASPGVYDASHMPEQRPQHNGYPPQRSSSFQAYPQSPPQMQNMSYPSEPRTQTYSNQQPQSHYPLEPQSTYASSQVPLGSPPADPSSTFYYGKQEQMPATRQPHNTPNEQQYTSQPPSPQQYRQVPPQAQSVPPPQQPGQFVHRDRSWEQQQPSMPQQPQHSLQTDVPYPTFGTYTQESFPSAPHHRPQPKVVEESLIDL